MRFIFLASVMIAAGIRIAAAGETTVDGAPVSTGTLVQAAASDPAAAASPSFDDPFAYCKAFDNVDRPGRRYTGPKLVQQITAAFAKTVPADAIVWRCMDGSVWACQAGDGSVCNKLAATAEPVATDARGFVAGAWIEVAPKRDTTLADMAAITALLDKRTAQLDKSGPPNTRPSDGYLDLFRARLAQCWAPPLGWNDPSEVRVVLLLFLNPDGTLNRPPTVLERPVGTYSEASPESAIRALKRCAPFQLPAAKYDEWRELRIAFDPRDMGASETAAAGQPPASSAAGLRPGSGAGPVLPAAPSFDCANATAADQKLICANPSLSAADAEIESQFQAARKLVGTEEALGPLNTYNRARSDCGADASCIEKAQRLALDALKKDQAFDRGIITSFTVECSDNLFMDSHVSVNPNSTREFLNDGFVADLIDYVQRESIAYCEKELAAGHLANKTGYRNSRDLPADGKLPRQYDINVVLDQGPDADPRMASRSLLAVKSLGKDSWETTNEIGPAFAALRQADAEAHQQEHDEALRQNREAGLRNDFRAQTGLTEYASIAKLTANPFKFKDEVVGLRVSFQKMLSEDEAVFAGDCGAFCYATIVVSKTPATQFSGNEDVILATRVHGVRSFNGTATPDLEYVGAYFCPDARCDNIIENPR